MGFDSNTLLEFVFGMIVPVITVLYFVISKRKKELAYDSIAYGFVSFLASIIAAFIVLIISNTLFASISFGSDSSALTAAGGFICFIIFVIFVVCEWLKISTIKHFRNGEGKTEKSGIGYAAGVLLAQNGAMFVFLNIFSEEDMDAGFALFSGAIICVTGIMYTVIAEACDRMLKDGHIYPAFALSGVYYLFWISAVVFSTSRILLFISLALFFALSLILGGVFIVKSKK